jgi:hypothetical protein
MGLPECLRRSRQDGSTASLQIGCSSHFEDMHPRISVAASVGPTSGLPPLATDLAAKTVEAGTTRRGAASAQVSIDTYEAARSR